MLHSISGNLIAQNIVSVNSSINNPLINEDNYNQLFNYGFKNVINLSKGVDSIIVEYDSDFLLEKKDAYRYYLSIPNLKKQDTLKIKIFTSLNEDFEESKCLISNPVLPSIYLGNKVLSSFITNKILYSEKRENYNLFAKVDFNGSLSSNISVVYKVFSFELVNLYNSKTKKFESDSFKVRELLDFLSIDSPYGYFGITSIKVNYGSDFYIFNELYEILITRHPAAQ